MGREGPCSAYPRTGNSGGGTLTSYLMALDDRIVAAAPSCYLTTLERLFATIGPQDAEQNFPGQVAHGIEHADYVTMRAPKPTLILTATQDFFNIEGSWTTFREAKRIYGLLGHGERVDLFEFGDKHGFSKPRREAALRWMRRWLQRRDDAAHELPIKLCKDAELQCTKSGEVLRDFADGVSVVELNKAHAAELAPQRAKLWQSRAAGLAAVRRLTAIRDVKAPHVRLAEASEANGKRVRKIVLERDVPVPGFLFEDDGGDGDRRTAVLWVAAGGKTRHDDKKAARFAKDAALVLSIDVRGVGETRSTYWRRFRGWFGSDFGISFLAMHAGRPLLGQRTEDVLAAVTYLASRADRIEVVGTGICGPVVLHAAALDSRIAKVTLVDSISSWTDVVAQPLLKRQLCNVVPFALEAYDLPDLVAAIAPRRVEQRSAK